MTDVELEARITDLEENSGGTGQNGNIINTLLCENERMIGKWTLPIF